MDYYKHTETHALVLCSSHAPSPALLELVYLQFEVEAVAPEQLAVLLGEAVVLGGGRDLLALHQVDDLQHLEAYLGGQGVDHRLYIMDKIRPSGLTS